MLLVVLVCSGLAALASSSHECSWDPSQALLQCSLESKLDSRLAFAKHQREATSTLKIVCQHDQREQSEQLLEVDYSLDHHKRGGSHHNPWPHLQSLLLENCPLLSTKVINHDLALEDTRMRTQNNGDVLHDVIKPLLGGRNLRGLRHLALVNITSGNSVNDFSSGLWCEVGSNLVSLNLSSNGLSKVPGSCQHGSLGHLEVLNLADNVITSLDDSSSALISPSLTHLDVSRNRLQSFKLKLGKLQSLDVSENKLTSTHELFEAVLASRESLQEIHAQGNQLDKLPNLSSSDNVVKFDNLLVLNLSRNAIESGPSNEVMLGLHHLVALDLSHNKLVSIDEELFRELGSLQVLSLAHNQIVQIRPESLAKLTRLHVLVLSHNNLDDLQGLIKDLPELRSLSLDHNRLKDLSGSELFGGCSNLRDLSLAANFLRRWPSAAFQPIAHHLHTLDMGENSLRELEPLTGFKSLYGLRLAGNRLRNLTSDTFQESTHIKMLNLADNLLEYIDLATFEPLKHLKALRLDNNRLEDINGLLTVQHQLQWLNVSHNHLQWFDYAIIPKSVIWLSLRHNRIEELGNYYNMQEGFHLTHLDIGHNSLLRMDRQALQPSLQEIYADNNMIQELAPNMFNGLHNLSKINLTSNQLETFPLSALTHTSEQRNHGTPTQLWLAKNPLACDCEMEWLQRINSLAAKSPREFPVVADWPQLSCRLNNRQAKSSRGNASADVAEWALVSAVRPSEFLCSYETHCFALCMCCDFFACDCRMKCSDGCHCYHDQTWSSNIIECGNRGHRNVPEFIPMDATSVYLDGNNFEDEALLNDEFIGRKHLTSLYLNGSQIAVISNQTLKGLSELLVLHLEDNNLTRLETGQEFDELISLRELYLHNNALEFIHPDTLRPLASTLLILTLHGNRLKVVDFHVWDYLSPQLRSVSLSGNQWTCQCNVIDKFTAAIKANPGLKIVDLDDIKCFNDSHLALRNGSQACADVLAVSFRSGDNLWATWDSFLPVLAVTVASTIIVISLIILAVAARKPIRSWFQRRYDGIQRSNIYGIVNGTVNSASSKSSGGPSANKYDVLVLCESPDEDFVSKTFIGILEAQSYRAALHGLSTTSGRPPVESSGGVCVIASHSSYIQNEDLLTLSRLCRNSSRPLALVALDTTAAKSLRRIPASDLPRGTKTLLWDTKSFWPTWHSVFPNPSTTAVKSEDMWTYLKGHNNSGDSSLSTQSTSDTLSKSHRRFATQRPTTSHFSYQSPSQQPRAYHSTLANPSRGRFPTALRPSANVIENPMASSTLLAVRHDRSQRAQDMEEEPIYHSLDEETAANDTVYINADLEVVYPVPCNHLMSEEEEEELNGLLADCYENEESLMQADYVPSPAPGSFPRNHLPYSSAPRSSGKRQKPPGYLV